MSKPGSEDPIRWGWTARDARPLRGEAGRQAALTAFAGLAWGALASVGVAALRTDGEALRLAGAAVVGLLPMTAIVLVRRRLARADELQALLLARAVMFGALWAIGFAALIYAVRAYTGDPLSPALFALLPPAAFAFGGLMLAVERQALTAGAEGRS